MHKKQQGGMFTRVFGDSPRNLILEFFLELRELDFPISTIARETGLKRATAYNTMEELISKKFAVPTRKLSGSQLYKLNMQKPEVKILIEAFNLILADYVKKVNKKELAVKSAVSIN